MIACSRPAPHASSRARVLPWALVITLATPALAAEAQPAPTDGARLAALRDQLQRYDIEGDGTFEVLRGLAAIAEDGRGEAAREARVLRTVVAADLLVISRVDARHAPLEARIAEVLGTTPDALVSVLIRELEAVRTSIYRSVARDALEALALIDEVDVPLPVDWTRHRGVRRDLLLLSQWSDGVEAGAALDPCARTRRCEEPWASWDGPTRTRIAALREASAASVRLARAAATDDPLVRTLAEAIEAHRARLETVRVDTAVWLGAEDGVLPATPQDASVRVERLLVVERDRLRTLHAPPIGVREGRVVSLAADAGEPASTGIERAFFPLDGEEVEQSVRVALGPLVRGAALALAATSDASVEGVWRTLGEAHRSGVASVALLRRAPDGSLAGGQLDLAAQQSVERGDVLVRVRPGYLVVERDETSTMIERTRGEGGLEVDLRELERRLAPLRARRVLVTFAGPTRASDVLGVALALGKRMRVGLMVR